MNLIHEGTIKATKVSNKPVCMCDGVANRSVINDVNVLHGIKPIPPHHMFYAPNANETVINPTDIVNTYPHKYNSCMKIESFMFMKK